MIAWLLAALTTLMVATAPQVAGPQVRILEPKAGAPAMELTTIRVAVEPASEAVQHVTVFADGRMIGRIEQPPFECAWNAGPVLREHTILVEALLASGRRIRSQITTPGAVDPLNDKVDRVLVTVSVLDGNGRFVRGLQRSAFKVFEDNVRRQTDFFTPEQSSLELAVGIDISDSMVSVLDDVKRNVKRFLSSLRTEDKATVGAFNERYYILAEPNVDRATQLKKVDQLAAWGMTSLYDMVLRSFDQLGARGGRQALVIFTDGADTSSRVRQEALEKRVERSDANLYIIGQGSVLQSLCDKLARKSGGKAFFPKDAAALAAAFDAITDELANQYLLTYDPRTVKGDHRFRKLRVEVEGGYQVRHREGYTPR